jgi:hypothetical protein
MQPLSVGTTRNERIANPKDFQHATMSMETYSRIRLIGLYTRFCRT